MYKNRLNLLLYELDLPGYTSPFRKIACKNRLEMRSHEFEIAVKVQNQWACPRYLNGCLNLLSVVSYATPTSSSNLFNVWSARTIISFSSINDRCMTVAEFKCRFSHFCHVFWSDDNDRFHFRSNGNAAVCHLQIRFAILKWFFLIQVLAQYPCLDPFLYGEFACSTLPSQAQSILFSCPAISSSLPIFPITFSISICPSSFKDPIILVD